MPTDGRQHITRGWHDGWSRDFMLPPPPPAPEDWGPDSARPWPDWPKDRSPAWLGAVAGGVRDPASPARCADHWLAQIAADLKDTAPRHGRSKHLVALPVIGTGAGGHYRSAGDVLTHLMPVLRQKGRGAGYRHRRVAKDPDVFAAARAARGADPSSWPEVPAEDASAALALAQRAGRGELVLFLGAGASAGAGLPDWNGLLQDLARAAGVQPDAPEWKRLAVLDQAALLQRRLPEQEMTKQIAKRMTCPEAALQHFLLASLPVDEVITTNYDDLFELASGAGTVSVLPHAPRHGVDRWLLKMHGCVGRPSDIVLTREDYLRYEQRRVALTGIVQAMLLTRHMLFVGFSLNDEDFHKVADAVRRARDPDERNRSQFGTVLKLAREPYVEELWRDELGFVSMGGELPADQGDADRRRSSWSAGGSSRSSSSSSWHTRPSIPPTSWRRASAAP